MFKKIFIIILFLSFGIIIGYYLKPQINVIIYDQTKSIPKADDFQQMLNSDAGKRAASLSPEIAEDVMRVKSLTPLVKAGPFHLSFNPKTNDFLILQMVDQQPIVEQATEGDEISLLFTAKGLGPFFHFLEKVDYMVPKNILTLIPMGMDVSIRFWITRQEMCTRKRKCNGLKWAIWTISNRRRME